MIRSVPAVAAMQPYALADLDRGLLSLAQNESHLPPSPAALAAGQDALAEQRLYLTQFRAYDPVQGRWLSRDPLGEMTDPGGNLYAYVGGKPVMVVDPSGLASCIYSISSHTLICIPNDGGSSHQLGPNGVFSGIGECTNDPQCSEDTRKGPIPPGSYNMNKDARSGHEDFWRLEPNPPVPGWKYYLGFARNGFMLHPGTLSLGCITTDKNNADAMRDYHDINNLLNQENGENQLKVVP